MTDREMLELAAKAIGLELRYNSLGEQDANYAWNPLTDDGTALRLAAELHIPIQFPFGDFGHLCREVVTWSTSQRHAEQLAGDPYAATRRAITRAAAEIGSAM